MILLMLWLDLMNLGDSLIVVVQLTDHTYPFLHHTNFEQIITTEKVGIYSVILQSLVDYKYCFMDVYVGWPGSVHDARVFANSQLYRLGSTETLFPRKVLELDGVDVPVVILADSAYPLMSWLLKPFAYGTTNMEQQRFNYIA